MHKESPARTLGPAAPGASAQATLQRIAQLAGVSVTTVSRVLSDQARRYRISAKTEAAVREQARACNFVPNQLARGLRLKKTLTIGLVIPDIANPFFSAIARQVALGARRHGYSVILCDSQDSLELERESIDLLCSRHVEGMAICPVGLEAGRLAELGRSGMPLVLIDRYFPDEPLPYVACDHYAGGREATELLLDHGHRRIACLQGLRGAAPNELRVQGHREALAARQVAADEALIVGDSFSEQSGYIETKLLLRSGRPFTAILALSNLIALGALRALAEEKRRIPEDISIIAYDDQPYSAYLATPMTTVAQPCAEMGDVAVKLLFDQIQAPHREPAGGVLLPTSLIVRKSVRGMSGG